MRVLIVALVPSHLMSMVPVAWALRAAGHEVLVAGGAPVVERAAAAGLSGAAVSEPPGRRVRRSAAPSGLAGTGPDWTLLQERWRQRVDGVLDEHLAVARDWRPDLLLVDPIEFSGLIVAAALRVPAVLHRWGPDRISSQSVPRAVEALAGVAARRGVEEGPALPSMVLDPCPPTLQCPEASASQPIRFVPFNGAGSPPGWAARPRTGRRLCVSFGGETSMLTRPVVWESLMRELAAVRDLESVVTAVPRDAAGLPAAVRVPGPVPLDLFLGGCDALLHHGGAGTALTGLAFGVPQLIVAQPNPSWAAVGERVAARGAGVVLDPDVALREESPSGLRVALEEVLSSPGHRSAAESLADEMSRLPAPSAVVPLLTELAAAPVVR
ncbi:UDP:flavonoid glycosyltransferase YjiC (YdhE family) [Streptomyces aurantiacus]|uniref:nucleotide disphospho-sugar-binding domain-containing protein n=1 Tax=Streptomyces aurantiacus TaxID=47760 RepID=UPI00278F282C|nr:nucleotide disphospho-sugar-binding domain-containing protein [Streptomyces aurantiacus]MDQ0779113.1 UDP:flavonoid glycosyltransferase YjiC (YdhE family) [Streptomyces aurantiacus]